MAKRMARILAGVAFIASLAAIVPAALVVHAASGSVIDVRLLWVLVPILAAGRVAYVAGRTGFASVVLLTGACWGFLVLGAWSLGLFFAPTAVLLAAATIAHVVALRPGLRAAIAPLWFLCGATGVAMLFFVRDWARALFDNQAIAAAPAVVAGTWTFAAVTLVLAAVTQATSLFRR